MVHMWSAGPRNMG